MSFPRMTPATLSALAAAGIVITATACSRAYRAQPEPVAPRQPAAQGRGIVTREFPADTWQTPDSYWTAWRSKYAQPAASGGRVYYASADGNDNGAGTAEQPWRSLQKASVAMQPGDTLMIADGEYPGNFSHRRSGEQGRPITFRAIHPGKAIVRGDQTGPLYDPRGKLRPAPTSAIQRQPLVADGRKRPAGAVQDAIHINHADFVVLEGLTVRSGGRRGIWVDTSNNVVIRGCRAVQNNVQGIFASFSDDLLLEYNECAYSAEQHGVYLSSSGDRPVVRNNSFHDNTRSGIQLNGGHKVHDPAAGKRGDGIIEDAVIEGNVIYNNGTGGAAGINLACVCTSKIVNNLIFNNLAGGIALFNDEKKTEVQWGSKKNKIFHNTIYFRPGEGRYCIGIKRGSTDNVIRNNILCGGKRGAFEYDDVSSFTSDNNLIWSHDKSPIASNEDSHAEYHFEQWKQAVKADANSAHAAPEFVNAEKPPYDFHLRPKAKMVARASEDVAVRMDLDGKPRLLGKRVVGCYEGVGK